MKKSTILWAVALLFISSACGSRQDATAEPSEEPLIGYWESYFEYGDEIPQEREDMANAMLAGALKIRFKKNNRVTSYAMNLATNGTYTVTENRVVINNDDNSTMSLERTTKGLRYSDPNGDMYFKKVEKFEEPDDALKEALVSALNARNQDPFYGSWELESITTGNGHSVYAIEEIERGTVLSLERGGTYSKRLSATRTIGGNHERKKDLLILNSPVTGTQKYTIKKLKKNSLVLEDEAGLIRRYRGI